MCFDRSCYWCNGTSDNCYCCKYVQARLWLSVSGVQTDFSVINAGKSIWFTVIALTRGLSEAALNYLNMLAPRSPVKTTFYRFFFLFYSAEIGEMWRWWMCSTPPNLPVRGMLKNIRWRSESAYIYLLFYVCLWYFSLFRWEHISSKANFTKNVLYGNGLVFLKKHLRTECKPLIHLRFPRLQSDYPDRASMANHPSLFL